MSKQQKADILLLLVTAFWGSSYYLISLCLQELEPLNLNAIRFLVSSVFLSVTFFPRLKRIDKKTCIFSMLGALSLIVVYTGATYGVKYTSISNAGFIISLTVVFVPFFEWLLFRKKPTFLHFFILLCCVVGLGLLTLNEHLRPKYGDVLCLISALAGALNLIITEKAVSANDVDPISMTITELAIVGCLLFFLSCLVEKPHFPRSSGVWYSTLFLSIVCTGGAFSIQASQQRFTSATNVGLIYTFEPVFSAVIAFFLSGERLGTRGYIGAILMIMSLIIIELQTHKDELKTVPDTKI